MASDNDFLLYVLDLLREVSGITYRKMMGEYVIYKDGKVYSLNDAYEKEIIADEDFALVADALNRRYGDYGRYRRSRGSVNYALTVLRAVANLLGKHTPLMLDYFDSDGDGAITISDALFELRIAAGLVPEPWLAC